MRIDELKKIAKKRHLDEVLVTGEANILAFTGIKSDNAILTTKALYTDFRYIPAAHRIAPKLKVIDIKKFNPTGKRIGYEGFVSHARFLSWQKKARKAMFVDVADDLAAIRAVKLADEKARLRASEALACEIWEDVSKRFKRGMSEKDMARLIKKMMIDRGEGEAFETIVCIGKNAAECHHEPDDTKWNGKDPILVDMGVKLNGVCSDLTRNLVPRHPTPRYRKIYALVLKANLAAIKAAKPGITAAALDQVARNVIKKGGFDKAFGHSLGHGVGYEIHESPTVGAKSKIVLKPGMAITIEPGIYLENELGVRIEDLVLITENGCEVLSRTKK